VSKLPKHSVWTQREGIEVVQALELHFAREAPDTWHAALGGSVLHKGRSEKDLDVIVIPHAADKSPINHAFIIRALDPLLVSFGWKKFLSTRDVHEDWERRGITDEKHVSIWLAADGRRVDVLVLR
jgi:hypothetical protein